MRMEHPELHDEPSASMGPEPESVHGGAAASLAGHLRQHAAEVLRRDPAAVPLDRPLIALGLDSLSAAELQQAVAQRLGLDLPVMELLLDGATLLDLAHEILARSPAAARPAAMTSDVSDVSDVSGSSRNAASGAVDAAGPEPEGVAPGGDLPLAHGQQALWFLQRLAPASAAYHIAAAMRIDGELNPAALLRCFTTIVDRHPALRTTFADRGGRPVARVAARLRPGFAVVDLAGLAPRQATAGSPPPAAPAIDDGALAALLAAEAARAFDLERGPLLRVTLFRRSAREHALLLAVHHLAADFQSLAIIASELAALYPREPRTAADGAEGAGGAAGADASQLPLPAAVHGDFVRWQQRLLAASGERLWSLWHDALRGPLPDLDLPTDRPRPAVQSDRGASVPLALDRQVAGQVQALAQEQGATLFMTLLAGLLTLLHRYTGQVDLLVGTPVAGRGSSAGADLGGVVGCCVNPVVLRTDLAGEPTFRDLLGRVRRAAIAAFAGQDYPFALLAERLQPVRDPSRSPLFQVMFTLYRARRPEQQPLAGFALGESGAEIALGPLTLRSWALPARPAQLDLSLSMAETPPGIAGSLVYAADLFDRATAARMALHLQTLLAAAAADPDVPIGSVDLLAPAEREEVLAGWNATAASYPRNHLAHELFEAQADRTPDACAVAAGATRLTYRELDRRANQLAHQLIRLGVGPESTVGLCCERSPDMVVGVLGVLKAGGAYLPLDPAYPAERLRAMLDDSGATLVLTQEALRPVLADFRGLRFRLDEDWPAIAALPTTRPRRRAGPENPAYLIYTSGSTGRPKGVEVPHRGLVNFLCSMLREPGLAAGDRLLSVTTLSFDIAGLELHLPLAVGATVVLASREAAADGRLLLAVLRDSGATVMQATPSTWRLLLAAGWQGQPRLRALCGGEPLPLDLATQLAAHGESAWNLYGPTETTIWSAIHRLPAPPAAADPVLAGKPIANTRIYLVDRRLQPVVPGVPGELLIGGDGLARGYLGRPDLTADRFMPDPFGPHPGARLYRTGDLARHRPGGVLEILGRLDHQVKIRGFRIELGEVEAALAAHSGVRHAVVVARPDRAGGRHLVAYLVPAGPDENTESTASAAPEELRRFLAERLPEAFIPTRFVSLPALPLTPGGKVDRAALPEPDSGRPELRTGYRAPRSELERSIAAVWREVLGVDEVGVHDNFFDLGGHSLLLSQVHSRLGSALGREMPLLDLFRHPTIDALALHLSRQDGDAAEAAETRATFAAFAARGDVGGGGDGGNAGRSRTQPGGDRDTMAGAGRTAVAIIGMAGRFPGAPDVDQLWRLLRDGEELIARLSDEELAAAGEPPALFGDPAYVKAAGILDGAELFAAPFFGYSPREAEIMDPQHRVFLECAWQALEDAGYDAPRAPERIGVFAAVGFNTYVQRLFAARNGGLGALSGAARYQAFIANDKDFVATRVSYELGLRGPSINVQTACSSSLVAVHLACQALRTGDCAMALAGGVSIRTPQRVGYLYEDGGILSPDGHCRAFAAGARGTVFGNGVGIVVLKPLARALADGDHVYAVVKGSAVNNDGGRKVGYTAPSVEGQATVIAAALAAAGVAPATIGYVEAHGTGTPMGDPIEIAALGEAFGSGPAAGRDRGSRCALGSVKTNLGHLDTAAGIAGLIKTVQALRHRRLPPSLHCAQPNPLIDFAAGPFYVNTALAAWPDGPSPRRAGVSSFGIGGTNAHVVLEEAPEPSAPAAARPWQLLVLSAKTAGALEAATDRLADALREAPEPLLADVAYTLQAGRHAFVERRVLVCREPLEAAAALAARDPARVLSGRCAAGPRPVAFLFPGQGTQYADMGREIYESEPVFRREIDLCADLLTPHLGVDLRHLLYPGEAAAGTGDEKAAAGAEADEADEAMADPAAAKAAASAGAGEADRRLEQTLLAQPALFAVEYALAQLWMEWGVIPQAMLGHSIGELVAACLAGVMALPEALALVAARGRLMQSLPGGAMLGVALSEADTAAALAGVEGLSLAAVNGPAACVVSGPAAAVTALAQRLEREGVRCRPLRVSHAFHSAVMEPILAPFAEAAGKLRLRPPRIPFVSNLTGSWITDAAAQDPAYWARHLRAPVRFADGVRELLAEPDRVLLEVGPGNSLAALVRQQDERARVTGSLRHPRESQSDLAFLLRGAGRLWLAGVELDWAAFHAGQRRRRVPLPTYPFERQRYWLEPAPQAATEVGEAGAAGKQPDLASWFQVPLWRQTLHRRLRPADDGDAATWLALLDRGGPPLLDRLVERLAARGGTVVAARPGERCCREQDGSFTLDPRRSADWDALFAALAAEGRLPQRIIHAWNVRPVGLARAKRADRADQAERANGADRAIGADRATLAEAQLWSFDSLVLLAQAWGRAATGAPARIVVLSNNLHKVAGEIELCPEKALLLGPVRVIPQEIQGLSCQSVDLLLPARGGAERAAHPEELELLEDLLAELTGPPPAEMVVAFRGGSRFARAFEPWRLPAAAAGAPVPGGTDPPLVATTEASGAGSKTAPQLAAGGVCLITGGLGGIGLALAEVLAERPGARLALLGRSALPEPSRFDEWLAAHGDGDEMSAKIRGIQALEARGAKVLAVAADVADEEALAAALAQVEERLGPIRGVIHAAGVPGGGSLLRKTAAAAEAVLAPKVRGTMLLHHLLQGRELDFFFICSSLTGLTGGFGQSDYCAANAFCDAFAQAHQSRDATIAAIAWDRWEEVGMAARQPSPLAWLQRAGGSAARPAHPLLDACLSQGPEREVWSSRLSADRHWVLAEHRVAGQPTVPGTAYLEMARAAAAALLAPGPIELRDVVFPLPLTVPAGESREVWTVVESDGAGLAFRVLSRLPAAADAEPLWLEHARGRAAAAVPLAPNLAPVTPLMPLDAAPAPLAPPAPFTAPLTGGGAAGGSLAELRAGGGWREPGSGVADPTVAGFLVTGPRWQSLRRALLRDGEALVDLELPAELVDDLDRYPLHPALLDVAAGAVQLLGQGNYLPLVYQRIAVYAPLTQRSCSHLRLRRGGVSPAPPGAGQPDLLTADLTIFDEGGTPLVEISGFTMKRVSAAAAEQLRAGAPSAGKTLAALGLTAPEPPPAWEGIRPAEGKEAFRRILQGSSAPAQIVVSTRPLDAALAAADALTPERLATALASAAAVGGTGVLGAMSPGGALGVLAASHARPEVSSLYAAPGGDFERRIAAVWERVLGIERIGVHDNFFELGGTSLSAIQLAGELQRELGVEVTTVSVFQAPAIAALARLLRPGGEQPTFARSLGRAEKKKQALELARRAAVQARR